MTDATHRIKLRVKSRQITTQFVIVQFRIEIKCELINHNLPPVQRNQNNNEVLRQQDLLKLST